MPPFYHMEQDTSNRRKTRYGQTFSFVSCFLNYWVMSQANRWREYGWRIVGTRLASKVASTEDLPEGRVMTVTARTISYSVFHISMANGRRWTIAVRTRAVPLGEGSIERGVEGKCWIRCPWHGWDFDPLTGAPPGGHEDTGSEGLSGGYPGRRMSSSGCRPSAEARTRTTTDVIAETLVNWGVRHVFGMVGHSNLGLADAIRRREAGWRDALSSASATKGPRPFAASAYGKLTGRPGCVSVDRRSRGPRTC